MVTDTESDPTPGQRNRRLTDEQRAYRDACLQLVGGSAPAMSRAITRGVLVPERVHGRLYSWTLDDVRDALVAAAVMELLDDWFVQARALLDDWRADGRPPGVGLRFGDTPWRVVTDEDAKVLMEASSDAYVAIPLPSADEVLVSYGWER